MIEFLKERILLFVLLLAGDTISLIGLIKAVELKPDAITIAAAVSLIPSLLISLAVSFFYKSSANKKRFAYIVMAVAFLFWAGFIISLIQFNKVNNEFGKVPFPKNYREDQPIDSAIVGGCHYTMEAQAEVDYFRNNNMTLTPAKLFADFNFDVAKIWTSQERDCARTKILTRFSVMIFFLMMWITLSCEFIIAIRMPESQNPSPGS